jgi:hypothetical protein
MTQAVIRPAEWALFYARLQAHMRRRNAISRLIGALTTEQLEALPEDALRRLVKKGA